MPETSATRSVALLLANSGVEQVELTEPRNALLRAGHRALIVAPERGPVLAMNNEVEPGDTFEADLAVAEVRVEDFDLLVLPGGTTNPDALRMDEDAVGFVRDFVTAGKTVAAICHGPWTLAEAGVIEGKTLTSWPSLKTDLRNAGATWVDETMFSCPANGWTLITSRNPDDLPAFNDAIASAIKDL